jgi:predicted nucleic acid-binding protein
VVTCPVVRGEILFGVHRVPAGRRRTELEATAHRFLSTFVCQPIPRTAGDHYAELKVYRQRSGLVIDENDLWIAATALALGAVLVSRDVDFAGIPGLSVVALV